MPTTTHTLTAGDLSDALAKVPRHTPVTIRADIEVNISDYDDDATTATYQGLLDITNVRSHINCLELEARA